MPVNIFLPPSAKPRLFPQTSVKSPAMQDAAHLTLDRLIDFNWELALGDQKITLKELQTLARLKSPLIQWRGQWVELNAGEITSAIDFWKTHSCGTVTFAQLARMKLGTGEALNGFEFTGVTASGLIGTLLDHLDGHTPMAELPPPVSFTGTLRPYQLRGYSWMAYLHQWNLGSCLADDMGLGKTRKHTRTGHILRTHPIRPLGRHRTGRGAEYQE